MPGNPFRIKPFRGGNRKAAVKSPQRPTARAATNTRPTSPVGNIGKPVGNAMRAPRVRVTTKGRHSVSQPGVRQGAKLGTPGRHG